MGDSDLLRVLNIAALLLVIGAVVAFVIAWRARSRALRVAVGLILLAVAAFGAILSFLAALLIAGLGVASLVLATSNQGGQPTAADKPDIR